MKPTILVLGSGPIRIGQGIEFDYSCVHCVWALQKMGYRAIIINNNPETVSTDFDTGDGLYFEPVTLEDVLKVVEHEKAIGVVCQFGGQTAINLAEGLASRGVKVLGTSPEAIAAAEDRGQFDKLLTSLNLQRPRGRAVTSLREALETAEEVGYPVLVRPSFVLGGRAMEICADAEKLEHFYAEAESANPGQPVLVDRYLEGIEAEVDVISDGESTLVPGIMEHIERAGVHSGDSMAVFPPVTLGEEVQAKLVTQACAIARKINVKGLMNIQFVIDLQGGVHILEVNPRASRTVPYLSKVTGIPMVELATKCMMGETLKDLGYESGLWALKGANENGTAKGEIIPESALLSGDFELPNAVLYAVKAPVFSFQKLTRVEPSLGPEMKSTGEILGIDFDYEAALYKALVASHIQFKGKGMVVITVANKDKPKAIEAAKRFVENGYSIGATAGTYDALKAAGVEVVRLAKIQEGSPNLLDEIIAGNVSLMVNTPERGAETSPESLRIRRACIESGVACLTSIDTAEALSRALALYSNPESASCLTLQEYLRGRENVNA